MNYFLQHLQWWHWMVLIEAIEQGSGKARLGDGVWKVSGPELPAGVRVVGVDGIVLKVISA
jgi:membrane protein implicated in regulation of membrane protease activity